MKIATWNVNSVHVLATQPLGKQSTGAEIARDERKGQKPSGHAPVTATFET